MTEIIPVNDKTMPELRVYACRTEVPLLRCFEPEPGVFVAETPKVIERALDAGYEPRSLLVDSRYMRKGDENPHSAHVGKVIARCEGIPVYVADQEFLRELLGYPLPGGLLCAMRRRRLAAVKDVCEGSRRIAVLENVTNPTNIGTIFRSAAALNMDAVLLTPSCADPLYRRTDRVSMGTVFQIPWTYFDKKKSYPYQAFDELREWGFKLAAMVLRKDSVAIDDEALCSEDRLAIILGSEGEGLEEETIDECDYKVCIPMSHGVDSLNVAEAATLAFWELGKVKD